MGDEKVQQFNSAEADILLSRLEKKFQRKSQAEADRRESRKIRHAFSGTDWDLIYEDVPTQN